MTLTDVFLSAQRALLGEITPNMRVITIAVADRTITMRVYYEGDASEELKDDLDAATTEIYADFPPDSEGEIDVILQLVRADDPGPILVLGQPIFARKGTGA